MPVNPDNRIRTFILGLDERLQGGVPEDHLVLLSGASGSMKSTVAFSLLYNNVLHQGHAGVYLTLEQSKESLMSHMRLMGMDVEDPRVRNRIAVIDLADLRVQLDKQGMSDKIDWTGQLMRQIQKYRDSIGFEILVFDSLGAFFTLTKMDNPRDEIFRIFEDVRRMELTSFFICEMLANQSQQFGEYGVEDFLSDAVIHIVMERVNDEISRKMAVVKIRHTNHDLGYKPMTWDNSEKRFRLG